MRFLKVFFTSLIALGLVSFFIYTLFVEITIRLTAWDLRHDIEKVTLLAAQPTDANYKTCAKSMSINKEEITKAILYPIESYQLRFESQTDYVIEMVCKNNSAKPTVITAGTLNRGVRKMRGSGIFVPVHLKNDPQPIIDAQVELGFYHKRLAVGIDNGLSFWKTVSAKDIFNPGSTVPLTSCEGFGFHCCAELLEIGEGLSTSNVLDCPDSCYQACGQRPVLLFFNTDPVMDHAKRSVTVVGSRVEITFGWEISDADTVVKQVTINYGDGEKFETTAMKGIVSHEYLCNQKICEYTAVIQAEDIKGYTLGVSGYSTVNIILKGEDILD